MIPERVQALLEEIEEIEEEITLAEEEEDTYGVVLLYQEKRAVEAELETITW